MQKLDHAIKLFNSSKECEWLILRYEFLKKKWLTLFARAANKNVTKNFYKIQIINFVQILISLYSVIYLFHASGI